MIELIDNWKFGDKNPDCSARRETCKWKYEGDCYGNNDFYSTECDNAWYFSEGNLDSNRVKYCPYCGNGIEERAIPITLPIDKVEYDYPFCACGDTFTEDAKCINCLAAEAKQEKVCE